MSNYGRLVAETTDRYLAAMDAVQESFLKSFATFAASMPASSIASPLADSGLPTAREISESSFSFAQKWLDQQQQFSRKLMGTVTELPTAPPVAFGKPVTQKSKKAN